jgi:hypothetical protein
VRRRYHRYLFARESTKKQPDPGLRQRSEDLLLARMQRKFPWLLNQTFLDEWRITGPDGDGLADLSKVSRATPLPSTGLYESVFVEFLGKDGEVIGDAC